MSMWEGMFTAFRGKPGPTLYASVRTSVSEDSTFWACITLVIILMTSYLLTVLGLPSNERFKSLVRFLMGAAVSSSLLFSLYGREWFSAAVFTRSEYTSHSKFEINATVGIKVGLKQVNVTLKANPEVVEGETINYNEKFEMENYKTLGRDFKYARKHGTPSPILWVAEYLSMDAGGVRYGRYYRIAGHYAFIALWSAFACWMVTCIIYNINVRLASYFTTLTGVIILVGVVSHYILSPATMRIKFPSGWLVVERGWCFWLSMATGIIVFLAGILLLLLDRCLPAKTSSFFSLQVEVDDDNLTASTPSIFKSRSVTPIDEDTNVVLFKKRPPSGTNEVVIVNEPLNEEVRKRSGAKSARDNSLSNNGATALPMENGGYVGPQSAVNPDGEATSHSGATIANTDGDLDDDQHALETEILNQTIRA